MTSPKDPTEIDQLVGRRVREQRLRMGLSQAKLAQALGITPTQLQKYEQGSNRIGASRLHQIACIVEVPIGFFFEAQGGAEELPASSSQQEQSHLSVNTDSMVNEVALAFSRIQSPEIKGALLSLTRAIAWLAPAPPDLSNQSATAA